MRKNLLALGLILVLVALASKTSPHRPPKISWEASFWLQEPTGFSCEWLDIEGSHYTICGSGCTGANVEERGRVQRTATHLELISDQGSRRSYSLTREKSGRALRDSSGQAFPERAAGVPRLHPDQSWLLANLPLELDGIQPGSSRSDVLHIFPSARPAGNRALTASPYPASPYSEVTIVVGGDEKVETITGIRLSQAGRSLLNECSTRRDIECLFGPLIWEKQTSDFQGFTATGHYGRLEMNIYGVKGMTPDEARLSFLRLSR